MYDFFFFLFYFYAFFYTRVLFAVHKMYLYVYSVLCMTQFWTQMLILVEFCLKSV